ncbi:MAG: hypothetical protein ACOX02_03035 [Acholeplasmatales bacterium]
MKKKRLGFAILLMVFTIAFLWTIEITNQTLVDTLGFVNIPIVWNKDVLTFMSVTFFILWLVSLVGFIITFFVLDDKE